MSEDWLVIDPGKVTGWSLWELPQDAPLTRLEYGLVKGGIDGFVSWMEVRLGARRPDLIICELFIPEAGHATSETDALQIQGALKTACSALGIEIEWQRRDQKSQVRDQILRDHGLWFTPKQAREDPWINHEDGRDVNDTGRHALAAAKRHRHQPTLLRYWPDV